MLIPPSELGMPYFWTIALARSGWRMSHSFQAAQTHDLDQRSKLSVNFPTILLTTPNIGTSQHLILTMDGMDFMDELNRLADNAESLESTALTSTEVERWKTLFSYSDAEASLIIKMQLADVTQERIPDGHWELIRENVEAAGHSRLSWEHLLQMKDTMKANSTTLIDGEGKRWTLLRMAGFLKDVERVKEITGTEEEMKVEKVTATFGTHEVVWVDDEGLKKIEDFIDAQLVLEKKDC